MNHTRIDKLTISAANHEDRTFLEYTFETEEEADQAMDYFHGIEAAMKIQKHVDPYIKDLFQKTHLFCIGAVSGLGPRLLVHKCNETIEEKLWRIPTGNSE